MGCCSAPGARRQNLAHCERVIESAMEFSIVGMCVAWIWMLCCKVRRTSFRTRDITLGDLLVELLMMWTTDMLSICKSSLVF